MSATHDDGWRVDAFVDGQLDLADQLAFERRLETDAALRARVQARRDASALLREQADRHAAPASLRQWVAAQAPARAASATPAPVASLRRPGDWWRRLLPARALAGAFAVAALALLAVGLAGPPWDGQQRLVDDVVASHARATLGDRLVDVASSEHHTVKPYLSSKLGFSPPVDDAPVAGTALLGGRVDFVDGRPVAALVYRHGAHVVDAFVWPEQGADSSARFATSRGYRTAHWRRAGMAHWLVSDVNEAEFGAIVEAMVRAPAGR